MKILSLKRRLRAGLASLLALMVMGIGAVVMVYPYVYMVGGSLKTRSEFATDRPAILPPRFEPSRLFQRFVVGRKDPDYDQQLKEWPLQRNYADAITFGHIDRFVCNSFLYAFVITAISLVVNVMAAYAFARMRFPGRDLLFGMLLMTMMIPSTVLLIPQFLLIQRLGLVDHPLGVVLPAFADAFGIFLLRQFFISIPTDLESAARVDGCSRGGILRHVIVPLSKPVLITLGLFTFMAAWNAFEWPLVVLSNQDLYPLTVGLALFRDQNTQDWPRVFAASVLGSVPLIALFYAAQRYLVSGITLSGIKG